MKRILISLVAFVLALPVMANTFKSSDSPFRLEILPNGQAVFNMRLSEGVSTTVIAVVEPPRISFSRLTINNKAFRLSATAGSYVPGETYDLWLACEGTCQWDFVAPTELTATAYSTYTGVTFNAAKGHGGPIRVPVGTGIVCWGDTMTAKTWYGGGF